MEGGVRGNTSRTTQMRFIGRVRTACSSWEDEIVWRVQQDATDVLPIWYGKWSSFLWNNVLGRNNWAGDTFNLNRLVRKADSPDTVVGFSLQGWRNWPGCRTLNTIFKHSHPRSLDTGVRDRGTDRFIYPGPRRERLAVLCECCPHIIQCLVRTTVICNWNSYYWLFVPVRFCWEYMSLLLFALTNGHFALLSELLSSAHLSS